MSDEPRVWIGCLGCYNAGTLTGKWFPAVDVPDDMDEFNKAIGFEPGEAWVFGDDAYSTSDPAPQQIPVSADHGHPVYGPHEELWVMDHENFGAFLKGECSPWEAKRVAELMDAITDAGHDVEVVAHWMSQFGQDVTEWDAPTEEAFTEAYAGHHESLLDFAYEWLDGTAFFEGVPEHVMTYQDSIVKAWLNDAEHGGSISDVSAGDGGVHVFWCG